MVLYRRSTSAGNGAVVLLAVAVVGVLVAFGCREGMGLFAGETCSGGDLAGAVDGAGELGGPEGEPGGVPGGVGSRSEARGTE